MYKFESVLCFGIAFLAGLICLATRNTDPAIAAGWFVIAIFSVVVGFVVRERGEHEKGKKRQEISRCEAVNLTEVDAEDPDDDVLGTHTVNPFYKRVPLKNVSFFCFDASIIAGGFSIMLRTYNPELAFALLAITWLCIAAGLVAHQIEKYKGGRGQHEAFDTIEVKTEDPNIS